jgi:hypothetical protein
MGELNQDSIDKYIGGNDMTEKIPIKIPVDLDKPRHFLLDIAAVARWEYSTGKPFFSMKTWKKLSKSEGVLMIWSCLVDNDPKLKPRDMIPILEDRKIDWKEVINKLSAAWEPLIISFIGGDIYEHLNR